MFQVFAAGHIRSVLLERVIVELAERCLVHECAEFAGLREIQHRREESAGLNPVVSDLGEIRERGSKKCTTEAVPTALIPTSPHACNNV